MTAEFYSWEELFMKRIVGRIIFVIPGIVLQVVWYVVCLAILDKLFFGHLDDIIRTSFAVMAILFVISLVSKRDESAYKILWVIVIVALPILGAILYFLLGNKKTGKKLKQKLTKASGELKSQNILVDEKETDTCIRAIGQEDLRIAQTLRKISRTTGFPVVANETSKYYPFGENMFAEMCEDLRKAEKYIFVEYFIIESGKFWDTLSGIMAERVRKGVDVRVMYDDFGSIATYSPKDIRKLKEKGIKCIPFNPFFSIRSQLNNRDHRKIMVIDGKVAYSGGVNLADEYINEVEKFGRWKDLGIRLTGDSVRSYTYMFAEFWNAFSSDKIHRDLFDDTVKEEVALPDNGFALPYYDSPMRSNHTSNEFFTEMLSVATDYAWFYTPYLMLGDALFDAFIRAAERGVDVRLLLPGIPDKPLIFRLATTYFEDLLKAGVKIYEYTPGFVHAKAFLSDDKIGSIGTVNLDYRSLFLHFECNSIFYKADILKTLKADYMATLEECREVTLDSLNRGKMHRSVNGLLRVAAPLL